MSTASARPHATSPRAAAPHLPARAATHGIAPKPDLVSRLASRIEACCRGLLHLGGTLGMLSLTKGFLRPLSVAVDHEAQKDNRHRVLQRFGLITSDHGFGL